MDLNLSNKLTLLRIVLIPLFMGLLLFQPGGQSLAYGRQLAVLVFIIAVITDGLDGYLARRQDWVTDFGKLMDPIADKLLISAALITLVDKGVITAWPTIIIIGREFAVTGLRALAAGQGIVISASNLGKYKANLQFLAIIALVLDLFGAQFLLWAAVALTIASGVDYFINFRQLIEED